MGTKAKDLVSLILFYVMFGLLFFCANCQSNSPQQQLQMRIFQQHIPMQQQLQALTVPMQKDLLSTGNRLQSQAVTGTKASGNGQEEWSHILGTKTEQQEIPQPQRNPSKNCKRRLGTRQKIGITGSLLVIPHHEYWRNKRNEPQPRTLQGHQPSKVSTTQIFERIREPSTTELFETIDEASASTGQKTIQQLQPSEVADGKRDAIFIEYLKTIQRPLPTIFTKIMELNPTKASLIARQPIATTVFDKVPEPSPTRILEINKISFSTKPSVKILQNVRPSKFNGKVRKPAPKKTYEKNKQPNLALNSERASENQQKLSEIRDIQRQDVVAKVTSMYRNKSYHHPYSQATKESTQQTFIGKKVPQTRSPSPGSKIDLKKFLKTSGGLSWSAIPSISLDYLLKNNQNSLLVIQPTAEASRKLENNFKEHIATLIRRIPPMSSTSTTTWTTTTEPTISNLSVTDLSVAESTEHSEEGKKNTSIVDASKEIDVMAVRTNLEFSDTDISDIDTVDDGNNLLEFSKDRRSRNRLIKIPEQRNTSLEELTEHREHGSSQLYIEIFEQNRSGVFPEKKVVANDDMDIITVFENFPHFNLLNLKSASSNEIKTHSQRSSLFSSAIDIETTDGVLKDAITEQAKNSVHYTSRNTERQPPMKSLASAGLTTAKNSKIFPPRSEPELPHQTAKRHQSASVIEEEVLQIEHEVARAHDLVDLELSGHGFKRSAMNLIHTSQMPVGIRSAIVASAAIVLTSLMTFMVIFVACRWKQRRRHHKLDYMMETYAVLKGKLPVISSRKTGELVTSTTSLGVESVSSRVSKSSDYQSQQQQIAIGLPDSIVYPATSLSMPSSKLNAMDPRFSEARENLFDALRKSFW